MKTTIEERWGTHPDDVKQYDTKKLRKEFLIEKFFAPDKVMMTYNHSEKLIVGGAMPIKEDLQLETLEIINSDYFCEKRELGIICVEGKGIISIDGREYYMGLKDAIYVGRGTKTVVFKSLDQVYPAKYYFASTPAHTVYPTTQIIPEMRKVVNIGSQETTNKCLVTQIISNEVIPCCQLQMSMSELTTGNVWNAIPENIHSKNMEIVFYFDVPEKQSICHLMGAAQETRHIFIANQQAAISPHWSVNLAVGTNKYNCIWTSCGEQLPIDENEEFSTNRLK